MNRRLKLLILALLAAVLFLSTAILSFRLASPAGEQTEPETQPAGNGTGVSLFEGTNGLWGAVNANGRVLMEPTWSNLRIMSDSVLVARRSSGRFASYGLIRTNGEQLVPFIYQSVVPVAASGSDLWVASFAENGKDYFHLYHADGTRWSDTAWDSYTYEDDVLTLESGADKYQGVLQGGQIEWTALSTSYPVGLHTLTVDFDETELKHLPPADILNEIGNASADYLRYLFITKQHPDKSLLPEESKAEVLVDYRYISTRLVTAEISRIKTLETDGLPAYLVQMQVKYQVTDEHGGIEDVIHTAMMLKLTRSASGTLTYSSFTDSQMNAAGGI